MDFANISKELRKQSNITQEELSKAIGVSKACISMIEIGRNEPTANTLNAYANFFNCSTDYLLGREDDFGVKENSISNSLSFDEKKLINIYRELSEDRKKRLMVNALDQFELYKGEDYEKYFKFRKA